MWVPGWWHHSPPHPELHFWGCVGEFLCSSTLPDQSAPCSISSEPLTSASAPSPPCSLSWLCRATFSSSPGSHCPCQSRHQSRPAACHENGLTRCRGCVAAAAPEAKPLSAPGLLCRCCRDELSLGAGREVGGSPSVDRDVIQQVTLPPLPTPHISPDCDTSVALFCPWTAGTCLGAQQPPSVVSASFWGGGLRGAPAFGSLPLLEPCRTGSIGSVAELFSGARDLFVSGFGLGRGGCERGRAARNAVGEEGGLVLPPLPPRALAHDSHPLLPDGGWGAGPGALGK